MGEGGGAICACFSLSCWDKRWQNLRKMCPLFCRVLLTINHFEPLVSFHLCDTNCVNHHYTDTLLLGFSVLARAVCACSSTETTIVGCTWQLRFGKLHRGLVHRLWSLWISSSLLNLHFTEVLLCSFGPLSKMVLDRQ